MPLARRTLLGTAVAATATAITGCGDRRRPPSAAPGPPDGQGSVAQPAAPAAPSPVPSDAAQAFTPGRPLRPALTPPAYATRLVDTVTRYLSPTPDHPKHPTFAGAVVLVAVDGVITVHAAVGDALRYGPGPVELPASQRVAMRPDSIFDLASITKLFTALLVLQQVERGRIDLSAPVAEYLPAFRGPGKQAITSAMLLAHTSGLLFTFHLARDASPEARRATILTQPLERGVVPGRRFRYGDINTLVLGHLLEKVTGQPLDAVVRSGLTGPLGLRDTGFTPVRWPGVADRDARLVATDVRRVRGDVHDDNARAMGGVAGHAGLFSTAMDLAVVGQMLLGGGDYAGTRVLGEPTVRRMLVNVNRGLPAVDPQRPDRTSSYGLGVELDQKWFMGRLASPLTCGKTGFTGTSLVVDLRRRVVLVLLSNRAHPDWRRANPDPSRAAVASALADALPQ